MNDGRMFDISDILSITTGKLVSDRHMEGVDDILSYMMGGPLWTHQLPRACKQCAPELLRQHPDLATIADPGDLRDDDKRDAWLSEQRERFGSELPVRPIPMDDQDMRNPLMELEGMVGQDKIIVVETP